MEQTRGLFCTCDLGVAHCQSQYQYDYHFWQMSSVFGQVSLAAVNKICAIHEAMNSWKNLKIP